MTKPQILPSNTTTVVGFDQFNDTVSSVFCSMDCRLRDRQLAKSYVGELGSTQLNRVNLARVGGLPIDAYRRKQNISKLHEAVYLVKFQLIGQGLIKQRGREAHLQPGDFVVCSTAEPYELQFMENYRQAVLAVPQALLKEMFHSPDDYLGVRMGKELPTNSLLSQFVISMVEHIDVLESSIVQRLEANVLDLLITALHSVAGTPAKEVESTAVAHLRRIKRFITMHLQDPRLSVEFIAESEGISKRYLHLLFKQADMSVSRYIQLQRLEACCRAFANPAMKNVATGDIAMEWGFGDISHFHRCFKAQYQITPKQYRIQMADNSA